MKKTALQLKQYALDAHILISIQIASIQAASKIDKTKVTKEVVEFVNQILKNPEDTVWQKTISHFVVATNIDEEWENFQTKIETIEPKLEALCSIAIKAIGA